MMEDWIRKSQTWNRPFTEGGGQSTLFWYQLDKTYVVHGLNVHMTFKRFDDGKTETIISKVSNIPIQQQLDYFGALGFWIENWFMSRIREMDIHEGFESKYQKARNKHGDDTLEIFMDSIDQSPVVEKYYSKRIFEDFGIYIV